MFQYVLAALTAALMFYFLIATRRSLLQRGFVIAFFGLGLLFVIYPPMTNELAAAVGIGRGADLILYLTTLFSVFLSFRFYLKFREVDAKLTELTRWMAVSRPAIEASRPSIESVDTSKAGDNE